MMVVFVYLEYGYILGCKAFIPDFKYVFYLLAHSN